VGAAAAKLAKARTTAERVNCIVKVEVLKIKSCNMKRFEGLEDRRLREREVENCCVEEGTRSSFRCFLLSSKSHCLGTS
jgi:hypothetical protein